ncbi:MAG: HAMP domain-containing histidine kinase [Lachnospiraceae bacterium]|nr:HAMP domain-containing histidine kinase [Lachnospiraceae bacterium]
MKRYNRMTGVILSLYLLLGIVFVILVHRVGRNADNYYLVEVNRIMAEAEESLRKSPEMYSQEGILSLSEQLGLEDYGCLLSVSFLCADTGEQEKNTVKAFFEDSQGSSVISALYDGERLVGYVKVVYDDQAASIGAGIFSVAVFFFAAAGLLLFGVLWHIRNSIVAPLDQAELFLTSMSKGNLEEEIPLEKGRYLFSFQNSVGKLRDELKVTHERELALLREKKMLILSLTHDVKTPLSTILLSAKALQRKLYREEEQKEEAYQQIIDRGEEILHYVEEIAEGSKEDIIEIPVAMEEFYLSEAVARVQKDYEGKCALLQVAFTIGAYRDILLRGDLHRTVEAVENLLENGLKYGDGLRLAITFTEEEGCRLLHVFNSGEPVGEEELPHLFDSFYRGSNVRGKNGSGLGLYICKQIMTKMGGDVYALRREDGMEVVLVFEGVR